MGTIDTGNGTAPATRRIGSSYRQAPTGVPSRKRCRSGRASENRTREPSNLHPHERHVHAHFRTSKEAGLATSRGVPCDVN